MRGPSGLVVGFEQPGHVGVAVAFGAGPDGGRQGGGIGEVIGQERGKLLAIRHLHKPGEAGDVVVVGAPPPF